MPEEQHPAISQISDLIDKDTTNAQLYADRAGLYYGIQGYDEAIRDGLTAIRLDPTKPEYYHELANVYLDYFQSRKALEVMEKAATQFPGRIPTLLKLSEIQLILKQYEASLSTIEQIFRLDPQHAEAFFMLGMNFKETGDTVKAISSFQKAVEIDPEIIDGWINLGQLHGDQNNPMALKFFDNAVRLDPANVEALHAKAFYLQKKGKLQESITLFKNIALIDPEYETAFFNAGLIYLDLDSFAQAYRQFDLTVQAAPTHISGYYYRGVAAELMGDTAQASKDYKQALRFAPDYEEAKQGLRRLSDEK